MPTTPQPAFLVDSFSLARALFEKMVGKLSDVARPQDHTTVEAMLRQDGDELLLAAYQAHLDGLTRHEEVEAAKAPKSPSIRVRSRTRQIETPFGRARFRRLGYKEVGRSVGFPLDEKLNLPAESYSHEVRRRVAEEARRGSFEASRDSIDRNTAAHVPLRQAEELAARAAQDFEAFYEQRPIAANDASSSSALLVLSSDGKGIRMRPESLRDATRKAAERAAAAATHGDPMAAKELRRRDTRVAVVSAIWDQEPCVRTPAQIVSNVRGHGRATTGKNATTNLPRPKNKRVSATVDEGIKPSMKKQFDEAQRRDPANKRTTILLVDGDPRQIDAGRAEARARGIELQVIVDVMHVLHYLWRAALALCANDKQKPEDCVVHYLEKLMNGPVEYVISGMRQAATLRGLSAKARKPIEVCAGYLLGVAPYVRYAEFLAKGFPIATGVIEGACRHLIQDRLGITGARWSVEGAEAVLRLRALHTSGDWDRYWEFHRRREHGRNYEKAA
jgi:hypothetical protein